MEGGSFGRPSGPLPEHVYWRRRVIAAAVVLVAVGLLAWSCGGSGDGDQQNAGARRPAAVPSVLSTTAPVASPTVGATAETTDPKASPPRSASAGSSAGSSAGPSGGSAQRRGKCRSRDIRVALRADADAYGNNDRPKFTVRVTSGRACTADVGPKRLRIVITSGPDRIWSSADCARARNDTTRKLSPHRPYRKVVNWKRVRSDPDDCGDAGARTVAQPGWYVAVASLGDVRSDKVVFQLTS